MPKFHILLLQKKVWSVINYLINAATYTVAEEIVYKKVVGPIGL